MPLSIVEIFGRTLNSPNLSSSVRGRECPFVPGVCTKNFPDGMPSGVCTLVATKDPTPVFCCPKRLYANSYEILRRVAATAFGPDAEFAGNPSQTNSAKIVLVFGKGVGGELQMLYQTKNFSVDWVLAVADRQGKLIEFVPVEVQTIDTTGSYRWQSWDIQSRNGSPMIHEYRQPPLKNSGFNWENVNKRILPQLITKGNIVRREPLCRHGLFFVCPTPVFRRIQERLAGDYLSYQPQPGAITFHNYGLQVDSHLDPKPIVLEGQSTTTIDQLALALTAPRDLPEAGLYGAVIQRAVRERFAQL